MKFWQIVLILLLTVPALAQDSAFPLVDAIACDDLGPNEVCYGQGTVDLLVDCEPAPDFDTPDERLNLDAVCLVRTRDAGVALLSVQPQADAVTMALVGDVEMQSVSSGDVGQNAVLVADAEIYSGPGSQYDVLSTLAEGTEVFVNACNCTRNWLRIVQADGSVGWLPARRVNLEDDSLPQVAPETPVFENMQAFTLVTGGSGSGLLIQMQAAPVLLQINGVQLELNAAAFVRSMPGQTMEIDVLAGQARIASDDTTLYAPAGSHVLVPLSERNVPAGALTVELVQPDHVAGLPLTLLPQPLDPLSALDAAQPTIVSVEECSVVSDTGEMACPLQFLNPDGDAIVRLESEFIYAPMGTWEGSIHEDLTLLAGDMSAGTLGWSISCSLAGENFIGPVEWRITLEDAAGHRSAPFRAAFNCIDG
ncbi:MAG: SH3 domain-containing protein [Phototrophicaceae bacterium]